MFGAKVSSRVSEETKERIVRIAKARGGIKVSKQIRSQIEMSFLYIDFARERIRKFLGSYKQGSISTGAIALAVLSEVPGIMDHVDAIVDEMVADGELRRVENGRVIKTDKLPITLHFVTNSRRS